MRRLALLLVLHQTLANYFNINDCAIDYRSLENMWEQKLILDLNKCNYDVSEPPPQNTSEPIRITVTFGLKSFKLISEEETFFVYTLIYMLWHDERLKWDPKSYDDLKSIVLMSHSIWTPGIKLINSINDEYIYSNFYGPCTVTSDGTVFCMAREFSAAKCGTDLREWPYDAQTCKLEFGPYSKTPKMLLGFNGRAIVMFASEYGAEWDIMDYQQEENQTSEKQLIMTFRLDRHADVLAAIVILPSFILSVLTLSTLFIDVRRDIRLLVICFSLMCHFIFLSELALDIPKHSKESPKLLLYYRGSFILTSITIVLSYALKVLCMKETECPKWIISCNYFVYTKFVKFIIWPRWGTDVGSDASATNIVKNWTDFANVANSLWIVVSLLVYLSLYCVFIPHPISYDLRPRRQL